jgi:hypothetical protein
VTYSGVNKWSRRGETPITSGVGLHAHARKSNEATWRLNAPNKGIELPGDWPRNGGV